MLHRRAKARLIAEVLLRCTSEIVPPLRPTSFTVGSWRSDAAVDASATSCRSTDRSLSRATECPLRGQFENVKFSNPPMALTLVFAAANCNAPRTNASLSQGRPPTNCGQRNMLPRVLIASKADNCGVGVTVFLGPHWYWNVAQARAKPLDIRRVRLVSESLWRFRTESKRLFGVINH